MKKLSVSYALQVLALLAVAGVIFLIVMGGQLLASIIGSDLILIPAFLLAYLAGSELLRVFMALIGAEVSSVSTLVRHYRHAVRQR